MERTVAIGLQDFKDVIEKNCFYIDKTDMIREWWEAKDGVTLITRPRRFGKTLNMSMLNYFFSNQHKEDGHIFENLSIWENEKYRELQGEYPVIFLSFADIKGKTMEESRALIVDTIVQLYAECSFLLEGNLLQKQEIEFFERVKPNMTDSDVARSLKFLSQYLSRYYDKKVIILLDEYDTPMQEAFVNGYWDEIVSLIRSLFNSTFKTNPYMERAIMTGITRVSKESIFSDLNNLEIVTTTSNKYATCFGFTEEEVFAAMDEFGYTEKDEVKKWYDGFVFGEYTDIYNPWSILNYLTKGRLAPYWSNTSGNGLVSKLLQEGNTEIKIQFEQLLQGGKLHKIIDEEIVFDQLDDNEEAIWSLLVASGYLKMENVVFYGNPECDLSLTNFETQMMFERLVAGWFRREGHKYNSFIKAMLQDDLKYMDRFMNDVALATFSYFDTGKRPSQAAEPERFYHGFVLGLMVELKNRYRILSNRESGFGRYDVMLEPKNAEDDAIIIEFKVYDSDDEEDLKETVAVALQQIEEKQYAASLVEKGISEDRIRKYGFAFEGKRVLIGK